MREENRKRERNGGDRDFSPPVARTRVSALDRHADAVANRGRPLAALNGGGRTAASDWPAILFYPTSHGSRAAPAEPPSRGFAPDATCSTKFLREPPRFCQCTKRTRVRQIKLSLEKKNYRSAKLSWKKSCWSITVSRRPKEDDFLSWKKSLRWQISSVHRVLWIQEQRAAQSFAQEEFSDYQAIACFFSQRIRRLEDSKCHPDRRSKTSIFLETLWTFKKCTIFWGNPHADENLSSKAFKDVAVASETLHKDLFVNRNVFCGIPLNISINRITWRKYRHIPSHWKMFQLSTSFACSECEAVGWIQG